MTPGQDDYFVHIDESLVGRKAGASAAEKARELRTANPLRSFAGRVLGTKTDERAWRKGSRGERFNGWLLDRLPPGWHVFHDIPLGQRGRTSTTSSSVQRASSR